MGHFARSLVASLLLIAAFVFLTVNYSEDLGGFFYSIWPSVMLAMLSAWVAIGYLSPLLSKGHYTDGSGLHLRMGLLFRADIPWSDVFGAEEYKGSTGSLGVSFSLGDPVIYLCPSRVGMVLIRMRTRRFPFALWKKADSVVVSVEEPGRLLKDIVARTGHA